MPRSEFHPRVHDAAKAIAAHGELARRSFAALERCDPLADAVVEHLRAHVGERFNLAAAYRAWQQGEPQPEPIAALLESLAGLPKCIDWRRIDRARGLFERTGPAGGFVLSLRSLMGGYTAPAGNKPLAFSGRLREQAPRRVAETAKFVTSVCAPGGMRPGAEGWLISLHVRLMHAQVRRLLWDSGRWQHERWAAPLNQHDMLATMLLFSEVYVEGLRILGFSIDAQEAEDWVYLWTMVAQVMGVEPQLLPRDYAEASALRELIHATQGLPDADSRALAAALLATPPHLRLDSRVAALRHDLLCAVSRMLVGDETADGLGLGRSRAWQLALPWVPRVIGIGEQLRVRVPALERQLRARGVAYWAWVVEVSLGGKPAEFGRPVRLGVDSV